MYKHYDIIVVGGGHAGCEAALASARMGCKTLLLSINLDSIAWMPCNPAIGGSGKSQIIAEVDALGGEIAVNAEKALSQIQILNTSKGLALRSKRVQCDKWLYSQAMKETLENQDLLDLHQTIVTSLLVENYCCIGVKDIFEEAYYAKAVILTTGTYLKGRIHCGFTAYDGGRSTELSEKCLSESLAQSGLLMRRFNTGTTPRIDKRSVDFSKLSRQDGYTGFIQFSFRSPRKQYHPQLPAFLGWTNEKTIEITKKHLQYQPSSTGQMVKVGPRTCPSIEEKVRWYPERMRHNFFLEQEGFHSNELYAAGLNMSVYPHCQEEILHSLPGLENARIMRPAYAIAYDFVDPSELRSSLEAKKINSLFCAGQINGTTGYDEAAAQGLIAGINAVLKIQEKEPLLLHRYGSYIGVMIDDMVNRRLDEPYRISPAHVEYRLLNRADNADQRLTPVGKSLGIVSQAHYQLFLSKLEDLEKGKKILQESALSPSKENLELLASLGFSEINKNTSLFQLLKRTDYSLSQIEKLSAVFSNLPDEVKEELEIEAKYEGYILREHNEMKTMQRMANYILPRNIAYDSLVFLSKEARKILNEEKPETIQEASRLSGVTPADILALIGFVKKPDQEE
jgi:tRNA uridine 5-carboxymethylaminomethyl modification enzyme